MSNPCLTGKADFIGLFITSPTTWDILKILMQYIHLYICQKAYFAKKGLKTYMPKGIFFRKRLNSYMPKGIFSQNYGIIG